MHCGDCALNHLRRRHGGAVDGGENSAWIKDNQILIELINGKSLVKKEVDDGDSVEIDVMEIEGRGYSGTKLTNSGLTRSIVLKRLVTSSFNLLLLPKMANSDARSEMLECELMKMQVIPQS